MFYLGNIFNILGFLNENFYKKYGEAKLLMKKRTVIYISLILLLLLSINGIVLTAEGQGVFADTKLEGIVRDELNISRYGNYTIEDLKKVKTIYAAVKDIENISGLEYCVNLEKLDLRKNKIKDLTPLKNLTKLKALYLEKNIIKDISPLSGLTNLEVLALGGFQGGNYIEDISPLAELTNLKNLDLSWNNIEDISPLAGLTNLLELNLEKNSIEDISALKDLINLTRLDLSRNLLFDNIESLENLTNVTHLFLSWNYISDISPLKNMINLKTLNLAGNRIDDIYLLLEMYKEKKTFTKQTRNDSINITYNKLDLRKGTKNRYVINVFIVRGINIYWENGNDTTLD